jgi:hypothetical protein
MSASAQLFVRKSLQCHFDLGKNPTTACVPSFKHPAFELASRMCERVEVEMRELLGEFRRLYAQQRLCVFEELPNTVEVTLTCVELCDRLLRQRL